MIIEKNPTMVAAMEEFKKGNSEAGLRGQDLFLDELRESIKTEDHCPCQVACSLHGNCLECVAVHRGHQDHLPNCFSDILAERIHYLSGLIEYKNEKGGENA